MSRLQIRRDTAANWARINPVLSQGEPGFETDTGVLKFGDGSAEYNSLGQDRTFATVAQLGTYARISRLPLDATASGVVGDGVTDDTANMQSAIMTAAEVGRPLSIQYLNVLVSAALICPAGIAIVGPGTITAAGGGYHMAAVAGDGVTFDGISFIGAATTETGQFAISPAAASAFKKVTVRNCFISATNCGVNVVSGIDWLIEDNVLQLLVGTISGQGYGVLSAESSSRTRIINNRFYGSPGHGRHAVYLAVNCCDAVATNNLIVAFNSSGIVCRANLGQAGVFRNTIAGNKLLSCAGPDTEAAAISVGGVAQDNVISSNDVFDSANIGIIVNYANDGAVTVGNIVTNNRVVRSALTGIAVYGAKGTVVSGNVVRDSSQAAVGVSSGIELKAVGSGGTVEVCDGTLVSGNIVTGSGHRAALTLNPGGTLPINTVIEGNVLMSGHLAGLAYELNGAVVTMPPGSNASDSTWTNGTSDSLKQHISRLASLDYPSIAANTTAELTATLAGVSTTGWSVLVTPQTAPPSGLMWSAYVSAINTVTVRLSNVTAADINPASSLWRLDAYKH